jgi:UDP-2,4-diacetamido-2,4,6-trideoxy-beta-L-altropyranose hydrolase
MRVPVLLVRADASVSSGTGHVMRCLALAQAWQDSGGRALFAMAQSTPGLRERITKEQCEILALSATPGSSADAEQTVEMGCAAEWIVVDGYHFGSKYQQQIKIAGSRLLFIDDYGHSERYSADVVLNQNAYATEAMYQTREVHTRLLLGTEYCLLRREFARWEGWRRDITPVGKRILVTFGGSDPGNATGIVVEGLRQIRDIEARVVVGGGNPHFKDLQRAAEPCQKWLKLQDNVRNMPEQMAWADLMIAGAGSTCWEACLLRLPMVLIDIAENQKPIARSLHSAGAAIHLGAIAEVTSREVAERIPVLLESEKKRSELSTNCGKLVDGRGAERVCRELLCA